MIAKTVHEGRNVKRIREILGVKQESLAIDLGLSQQAISSLEQKESLDKEMLEKIANVLKVPAEAIKNFNEESAVNFIANTSNHQDNANNNSSVYGSYTFNPLEKVVELYERILKEKDAKIAMLEKRIEGK